MEHQDKVKIAAAQEHYRKYGLKKSVIEPWEDGMRTEGEPGIFEWWYFDVNFEDQSTMVVTFFTKPLSDPNLPLTPMINVEFNSPDGKKVSQTYTARAEDFQAEKDRCHVRVGTNYFSGDLKHYSIHIDTEEIKADIQLTGIVPPWRPETGMILFGAEERDYFGWVVAVPKGRVHADIIVDSEEKSLDGFGYHDHNWGNKSLLDIKHHGHWGRVELDGYTMINVFYYTPKSYDGQIYKMFMLARDGEILADDSAQVTFSESDKFVDEITGKPLCKTVEYTYRDGKKEYHIIYQAEKIIFRDIMINNMPEKERKKAQEKGMNPVYFRFFGTVVLEISEEDVLLETHEGKAMWENMYFGDPGENIG